MESLMKEKGAPGLEVLPAYADASKKYRWLTWLSAAYATADSAISEHLAKRAAGGEPVPACKAGCSACCLNPVIQATRLELQGISWFLSEVMPPGPARDGVRQQLRAHKESAACPLLFDGACSVYPVRPLTCRHFYVAGAPCSPGIDPATTRPEDILNLGKDGAVRAATFMLQGMGFGSEQKSRKAAMAGAFYQLATPMHEMELEELAEVMDAFDAFRAQAQSFPRS
jgi:hypothetical protein